MGIIEYESLSIPRNIEVIKNEPDVLILEKDTFRLKVIIEQIKKI